MKNLLIILIAAAGLAACKNNGKNADEPATTIQWTDSTFHDLGKIKADSVVEVAYHFKNTGDRNLIIADVKPGCGCTDPQKPERPVAPGEEGVIKAKFNSKGQGTGSHTKYITVTANTLPSATTELVFRVEITD